MASVQFFLSQASGTEHLHDSNIISSSPERGKLVLSHPEGFGQKHSSSLSLSPHSPLSSPAVSTHSCIKLISGFKAFSISLSLDQDFPLLTLTLSVIPHLLLRHRFLLLIISCSLPLSPNYQIFQKAFLCFPSSCLSYCYCSSPPVFSVSTFECHLYQNWRLAHEKYYVLSSLHSSMYHLYPSVTYWFLLRWKAY